MTESDCATLVGKLFAAFPQAKGTDATLVVYIEALKPLPRVGALRDAIDSLIRTERFIPSIAALREEYRRFADRHAPPGLPEPEISDEQRRENLRKIRELAEQVGREVEQ